jgi:hypothetical protein
MQAARHLPTAAGMTVNLSIEGLCNRQTHAIDAAMIYDCIVGPRSTERLSSVSPVDLQNQANDQC